MFVVHRPTWLRDCGYGVLFDPSTGMRCVLGFLAKSLGVEDRDLEHKDQPRAVWGDELPLPIQGLNDEDADGMHIWQRIVATNDVRGLPEEQREDRLTDLFASAGIEVLFTDEPEGT